MSLSLELPLDPDLAFLLGPDEPEVPPAPAMSVEPRMRTSAGRAAVTRELAAIVARFDDPHASQAERYVVALDEGAGEVFELGRPYRASRLFPRHALKRNLDAYRHFVAFAQGQDTRDWRFWNLGIPNRKAPVQSLSSELKRFNKALNQELSHLRKAKAIEVLLLCIHLRYDHSTDAFDLHAHIICRVPEEHRDLAASHLYRKFSKTETVDRPIRNLEAAVTYALWGIVDPEAVLTWPEAAVQAAWEVTTARARLMRTGGGFALWRRGQRAATADPAAQEARRRKARHRAETAYAPATLPSGDRVLGRLRLKLGGALRDGVLVERAPPSASVAARPQPADASPLRDTGYPSATVATTQERPDPPAPGTPRPTSSGPTRARRPQAWWWRAWPYGRAPSPTAASSLRGLPGPLRRRLAACALDPRRRPAWISPRRVRSDPGPA